MKTNLQSFKMSTGKAILNSDTLFEKIIQDELIKLISKEIIKKKYLVWYDIQSGSTFYQYTGHFRLTKKQIIKLFQ